MDFAVGGSQGKLRPGARRSSDFCDAATGQAGCCPLIKVDMLRGSQNFSWGCFLDSHHLEVVIPFLLLTDPMYSICI